MKEEDIVKLLKDIDSLSDEDKKKRDLYLKRLGPRPDVSKYTKEELEEKERIALANIPEGQMLQGPTTFVPEIDKPFLQYYTDEAIMEDLPEVTIADYIWNRNKDHMDNVFAEYFNVKITYRQLREKVNEAKAALLARGIRPYDGQGERTRIGIALPTMPETFYLFLAIVELGCVATMIDPRINEQRIQDSIENTNCELVFCVDRYNEKFENVAKRLSIQNRMISVSAANSLPFYLKAGYKLTKKIKKAKSLGDYKDFIKAGKGIDARDVKGEYRPDDPVAIEFTGGTTNLPKGAILSNRNLVGIADQEKHAFTGKEVGDTFLDIMPPFIAYGLACGICATLSEGLKLRMIPTFEPEDFGKLILKYKPQHIIGVPSFYERLIKDPALQNADLSFLKYCIAGGDKLPVAAEERINAFLLSHGVKNKIIKGYGMTELSSVAAVNLDNNSNKLGSTGVPFPKNNIKVVDPETGKRALIGELGEVYEEGPTRMVSYVNNPELDRQLVAEDEVGKKWVKTGDRGKMDEDGHVFIDGRYKSTIVRPDGHNVYPVAIENIINAHPAVESCVVVGIQNQELESGEIPVAFIVFKPGYEDKTEELIKQLHKICLEKLPPRDIALDYQVLTELPMTSIGKVDRKRIKEEFEAGLAEKKAHKLR